MTEAALQTRQGKFRDPDWTAAGEAARRRPACKRCARCGSTPAASATSNAAIAISNRARRTTGSSISTRAEVAAFLDEIAREALPTREIGFTGGEPFMNPDILAMLGDALARGHFGRSCSPMPCSRCSARASSQACSACARRMAARLVIRVSLDHYGKALHEEERGPDTYDKTVEGIDWLARNGFALALAGRTYWGESEALASRGLWAACARAGLADRRERSFPARAVSGDGRCAPTCLRSPPPAGASCIRARAT